MTETTAAPVFTFRMPTRQPQTIEINVDFSLPDISKITAKPVRRQRCHRCGAEAPVSGQLIGWLKDEERDWLFCPVCVAEGATPSYRFKSVKVQPTENEINAALERRVRKERDAKLMAGHFDLIPEGLSVLR